MEGNNNKEEYKKLCHKEETIPIFSQPFWLDAVCGKDNWDVIIYKKGQNVLGTMPYYVKKRFSFSYVTMPKFTQNLGIWIKYPQNITYNKKLSIEKEIMHYMIKRLESLPISFFQQNFHFSITNWLPFYWMGYKQCTYYTYRIENISNTKKVFEKFHPSKKRDIAFGERNDFIIEQGMSANDLYNYHKLTLIKQGRKINYSISLLERILCAITTHKCGAIVKILDGKRNIHGIIFIIWDQASAYNLITAFDPDFRHSMASSLLFYETIKLSSKYVNNFDFEGSMSETIENSYRKFGTIQTPYFKIWKSFSKNPIINILLKGKM